MLTDEQLELGGFRFEDLQEKRIVKNRTDLARKQAEHGFPLGVKTGEAQVVFLKSEVFAWLRKRAALRDAVPAPVPVPRRVDPVKSTAIPATVTMPPKRKVGRPRKARPPS